jgi:hypothetical protein
VVAGGNVTTVNVLSLRVTGLIMFCGGSKVEVRSPSSTMVLLVPSVDMTLVVSEGGVRTMAPRVSVGAGC